MRRANSFHKYRAFYKNGEFIIGKAYMSSGRACLITGITQEYIYVIYARQSNGNHNRDIWFSDSFDHFSLQEISIEEFYSKYAYGDLVNNKS